MLRRTLCASFFGARGTGGEADWRGYVRKGRGHARTLGKLEGMGDIKDKATMDKLNRATKLQKDFEIGGAWEEKFYEKARGHNEAEHAKVEKERQEIKDQRDINKMMGKGNEGLKKKVVEASTTAELFDAARTMMWGILGNSDASGSSGSSGGSDKGNKSNKSKKKKNGESLVGGIASRVAPIFSEGTTIATLGQRRFAKGTQLVHPRSVLFVPGSNLKAMKKIPSLTNQVDAFILDLEDGVHPSQKDAARDNIYNFLRSQEFKDLPTKPRIVVRVNSPRTDPHWGLPDLELASVFLDQIEGIALPKVSELDALVVEDAVHPDHDVWAFFETARSIHKAHEICAQGCYSYAVLGTNDLAADLNIPTSLGEHVFADDPAAAALAQQLGRQPLYYSIQRLVNAARMHGLGVIDGVYNDTGNVAALRRETLEGRMLGLDGKTVIHPRHVSIVNEVYTPSQGEYMWARRVLDAANAVEGGGVATVDGKMVEWMHVQSAGTVVQRYERATEQQNKAQQQQQQEHQQQQEAGAATSSASSSSAQDKYTASTVPGGIASVDLHNAEDELLEKIQQESAKKL